jgi:hypothetical protein
MKAEWNGQLPLDGHDEVRKSGKRAAVERVKIRRHAGQYLGALRDTEAQPSLCSADDVGSLADGPIHAVLRLQASIRNDPARIGDVGPVSGNLVGAGGTAIGSKSH